MRFNTLIMILIICIFIFSGCSSEDESGGGSAFTYSATGTYSYYPDTGILALNTLEMIWNGFPATDESLGIEIYSVKSPSSSSMTWVDPKEGDIKWVGGGTSSSSVVGTWTCTIGENEIYRLTFDDEHRFELKGNPSYEQCLFTGWGSSTWGARAIKENKSNIFSDFGGPSPEEGKVWKGRLITGYKNGTIENEPFEVNIWGSSTLVADYISGMTYYYRHDSEFNILLDEGTPPIKPADCDNLAIISNYVYPEPPGDNFTNITIKYYGTLCSGEGWAKGIAELQP